MMAGLSSLLRLDHMFSIYQKIASGVPKTALAPRYDWLTNLALQVNIDRSTLVFSKRIARLRRDAFRIVSVGLRRLQVETGVK